MKPIILQTDKDGFVKIKTSELKKMFDDVYNEGYKDGQNSHWWTYTTPYYYTTANKDWWNDHITVNCDDKTVSSDVISSGTIHVDPNNVTTIKTTL